MTSNRGMATLWTASCLAFITSLLAWMTLQSVMSETKRSQHQLHAAQALAISESLLETSIALIDSTYSGQDVAIDLSKPMPAQACIGAVAVLEVDRCPESI